MTAAAHGNYSTKVREKDETIPGFSHLFSPCQHLKIGPSQKSFHLSEVTSLMMITYLNTRDLASHPKPSRLHNPA